MIKKVLHLLLAAVIIGGLWAFYSLYRENQPKCPLVVYQLNADGSKSAMNLNMNVRRIK